MPYDLSNIDAKKLDELNDGERHLFDWQFQYSGDFFRLLFEAISKADEHNLNRLALGFPQEVEAFCKYARVPGWWKEFLEELGVVEC